MTSKVAITIRVPGDVAEAIDEARGGLSRSAWVESLVEVALTPAQTKKSAAENKRIRESTSCPPHPRGRVVKGFCYRCGRPAA